MNCFSGSIEITYDRSRADQFFYSALCATTFKAPQRRMEEEACAPHRMAGIAWPSGIKSNRDSPLSLDSGDNGIGVYEVDGQLYALEDTCPHGPSLLSRGFIRDGMVKCPLHGAIFDIKTGKCLEGPAERDLEAYPVMVKATMFTSR